MKTKFKFLVLLAGVLATGLLAAAAAPGKTEGGPKGGRLLDKTSPKAEFHVEKDRTITIAFYDASLKAVPVADQNVTVIADTRTGKTTLEFERKGDVLVSKSRLPEGEGYNLVVRFKSGADARPQNFRFKLDLSTCGECKRAEYACTCDH